jgi:hypothetical protein
LKGLAMKDVGTLYGQLVYFTAIVAPLWWFGIFFLILASCNKNNLATLCVGAFMTGCCLLPV